jgi:DNA-binding NarL/FixJ family response regulator
MAQSDTAERLRRLVEDFGGRHKLSEQQEEILLLSASGLCRKEVAFRLKCGAKTVHEHWRRIYHKTRCRSEAEVVSRLLSAVIASMRTGCVCAGRL